MPLKIRRFHDARSVRAHAGPTGLASTRRRLAVVAASACTATALLSAPATAHDKCDSLANATTAAGVFWAPAAGFQVGYYLAKFVDELGEEGVVDPDVLDCNGPVALSPEDYERLTGDADPNGLFRPYWEATAAFVEASRAFNFSKTRWESLREDVRDARVEGRPKLAEQLQAETDAVHAATADRFNEYRAAHDIYAAAIAEAARIYRDRGLDLVPALTVSDVVDTMQASLEGDVPEFEIRFWVDIACTPPAYIDAEGVLAPADRFVNDEVPPGTFIDAEILRSPATMFDEIAITLASVVRDNLDRLLPDHFEENPALPVPCVGDLNDDGRIDSGDLGILLAFWGNCP